MFLDQIDIVNFRGIRELSLKLDETTVLIGENNSGKTTILEALQICLSRSLTRRGGIFSEYDYHLPHMDSQPVDSEGIEITLHFVERFVDDWPDEVIQTLSNAVQICEDGRQCVVLRVNSRFDNETDGYVTIWNFLNTQGDALPNARNPRNIIELQRLTPVFYLAALRDSAQEFRPRSPFWGPFVRSSRISSDLREELENELAELNEKVLSSHESFGAVKERLSNTAKLVPLNSDEPVGIEAIPSKVFDILSRTQVMLNSTSGARLPIGRHGEGTQSLAVICLFDAFLESRLEDSYTEYTTPILALEEPEAHLHPSATRSIAIHLHEIGSQKIIATHSGDLVASIPLTSLRRLRRQDGDIAVFQIEEGALTEEEIRKLDYHVRSTRGSLLFARCWLLLEGETDCLLFEECARIAGYDLVSGGISCIAFQQQAGVGSFVRLANLLGIEWLVVADGDSSGSNYINSAARHINNRPHNRHLHQLAHGDMELFLCMNGHGSVFEENVSPQKENNVTAENGSLKYWKQVLEAQSNKPKPQMAGEVVDKIEQEGEQGIPTQMRTILDVAVELAEETL